jgi:hypothetical protein
VTGALDDGQFARNVAALHEAGLDAAALSWLACGTEPAAEEIAAGSGTLAR